MGEPWRSWGVRSSNGTILHASPQRLAIAFGGKTRAEALESLYAGRLETHGWQIEAQWQEAERRAVSMIRKETRLCISISPTEESLQQLVYMEIPGPDARLGECAEGSPLPQIKLSEIVPIPEASVP
jgi:hypothetical protein